MKKEWKPLLIIIFLFSAVYYLPIGLPRFDRSIMEALHLAKWYAREHVLLCLVPAFFIAGGVSIFISQASVMKYLGAGANKIIAYSVASISGSVLAVCSCTVLPLFAGIYRMGAGIGPATAFLYSGPAVNVLAIILTARILGVEIGIARAVGAVVFSIVIGLVMHFVYRAEERDKVAQQAHVSSFDEKRSLFQNALYFASMIGILVFANWGKPDTTSGVWYLIHALKWEITAVFALSLALILVFWFGITWWKILSAGVTISFLALLFGGNPIIPFVAGVTLLSLITGTCKGETKDWLVASWDFAKQILPLLFIGVLIAGALMGRPDHEGLIPSSWISRAVGGNSFMSNFIAAFAGAFMYFATLTEVPILQGLIGNGMGKGPALALLLAGPALSLPNMLVIRSVMGTKKTALFVSLVIAMATLSGILYGSL